jgi:hypothetical protein
VVEEVARVALAPLHSSTPSCAPRHHAFVVEKGEGLGHVAQVRRLAPDEEPEQNVRGLPANVGRVGWVGGGGELRPNIHVLAPLQVVLEHLWEWEGEMIE